MTSQLTTTPKPRLFHLDNLRVFLTVLVILHHAAIAYGASGDWAITDPRVDEISPIFLTFFTALNQSYFMSIFFLLAGYFTPRSLERKGPGPFLKDRLIRLGIPLLVYTSLVININQLVLGVWMRGLPFRWNFTYEVGHLWFLQALFLFAVLYLLYRSWAPSEGRPQIYSDRFPPDRALIFSIIVLAILTFTVRIWVPVGEWVSPGFQLAHFVHYVVSFYVGILAFRGDWFNRLGQAQARRWGVVALVCMPFFFVVGILGGALEGEAGLERFLGGVHWQSLAYVLWESVMFISITVFLLYFFRERFNQAGPFMRAMAANVYTVYIIHQTVLITFNVLFLPVDIPTILKFPIVSLIVVPLCFSLATLIRKLPYADRVLG
jgi:membrane-bound acyltransferase YfiQ involved in biofilm formation